jgi:signal transduction histidine kinase
MFSFHGRPHVLGVVRDITAQVSAEQMLERQVAERTRELMTLLELSQEMGSTLELRPLLRLMLDQLRTVVDYFGAAVLMLDGNEFVVLESIVPLRRKREDERLHFSFEGDPIIQEWLENPCPWIIANVWADTEEAASYRRTAAEILARYPKFRSWMGIPLVTKDHVIGILALNHDQANVFTAHHGRLATAFAGQAAVAIENARLYEEAQEEVRRTGALAAIGASVALAGSLGAILNGLAECVVRVSGAVSCAVTVLEGDPPTERLVGDYPFKEGYVAAYNLAIQRGARPLSRQSLREARPVVRLNARELALALEEWEPIHPYIREPIWETLVSVPLSARGAPLGSLIICYPPARNPTNEDLVFLDAVGYQAAIAVDNARLFAEAEGKAALEERARLARELHDSVSQALYGIALGARTARTLADRDPGRIHEPLDYVLSLADAGLAEMRALIFELRPESLANEGLVAALQRQATLLRARHGLDVETALGEEPALAIDAKEVLHRIAQEAIQNVIKHAGAQKVVLHLYSDAASVSIEIGDDGSGFDPDQQFPGHMGLRSMRERAVLAGGSMAIESGKGRGTRLTARIPLAAARSSE